MLSCHLKRSFSLVGRSRSSFHQRKRRHLFGKMSAFHRHTQVPATTNSHCSGSSCALYAVDQRWRWTRWVLHDTVQVYDATGRRNRQLKSRPSNGPFRAGLHGDMAGTCGDLILQLDTYPTPPDPDDLPLSGWIEVDIAPRTQLTKPTPIPARNTMRLARFYSHAHPLARRSADLLESRWRSPWKSAWKSAGWRQRHQLAQVGQRASPLR